MRIAICDDNTDHRKYCIKLLRKYANKHAIDVEIVEFAKGSELLFALTDESKPIDLVYLDISMPGDDGITVAQKIRERDYNLEIIFFTVKDSRWKDAFFVKALHYIVKDEFSEEEFEKIFLMAAEEVQLNSEESLVFTCAGESRNIMVSEILYFEVYMHIVTVKYGDKMSFDFYTSLSKLEKMLIHKSFIRCHKSYLVSKKYIESATAVSIQMKNGNEIPIGRTYRERVKKELAGIGSK